MNNFCALILTHGRPDNVVTYKTLRDCGYTGAIFLVVDDEDKTLPKYIENFGKENILVFNKDEIAKTFDLADNFNEKRGVVFARNASFNLVRSVGYKYFIKLDDDYSWFAYRFKEDRHYRCFKIQNLDKVFAAMLEYYKGIPALSLCMTQGGDFIGGKRGFRAKSITAIRKAMNTFICSTERSFQFIGRINEDVNTYVELGRKGSLFLSTTQVSINQKTTQSNKGGLTELYLDVGTYVKTFYSVMISPSCVKVHILGPEHKRIHHRIDWNNAVPKIIRQII